MKKITIFICSHKKVELPQHEYFLPVQAGAALHEKFRVISPMMREITYRLRIPISVN